MNSHSLPWKHSITRAELVQLTDGSVSGFQLVEPAVLSGHETAIQGDVRYLRFRSGLSMHCSDTLEVRDLTTQAAQEAGVSCFLFLQGTVDMRLGERLFTLGASGGTAAGHAPSGQIINCAQSEIVARISKKGRHIRKVVISVPADWFEPALKDTAGDGRTLQSFLTTHLASATWTPSPRIVSLAEQILRPPVYNDVLLSLYVESRSLEIVGEALSCLVSETRAQYGVLRTREHERIRAIAEQLGTTGQRPASIEEIAREAGMSSSLLHKQFRAAYGMTVFEFIRNSRLEEARRLLVQDGVSVTEAAYRAGYTSAANFATAFKRRFGLSPKNVRS